MSTTESSATGRTGTAEDVERLARDLMGWVLDRRGGPPWGHGDYWVDPSGTATAEALNWNPFVSADADVQVLERVREVWGPTSRQARAFVLAVCQECGITTSVPTYAPAFVATLAWKLSVGTWARAALAVLREMERTEEGR